MKKKYFIVVILLLIVGSILLISSGADKIVNGGSTGTINPNTYDEIYNNMNAADNYNLVANTYSTVVNGLKKVTNIMSSIGNNISNIYDNFSLTWGNKNEEYNASFTRYSSSEVIDEIKFLRTEGSIFKRNYTISYNQNNITSPYILIMAFNVDEDDYFDIKFLKNDYVSSTNNNISRVKKSMAICVSTEDFNNLKYAAHGIYTEIIAFRIFPLQSQIDPNLINDILAASTQAALIEKFGCYQYADSIRDISYENFVKLGKWIDKIP